LGELRIYSVQLVELGIYLSNIRSKFTDIFLGILVGSVQGSDATVKLLVVGEIHLGEKWERIGRVGLYEMD
jgi:hypothetical protein